MNLNEIFDSIENLDVSLSVKITDLSQALGMALSEDIYAKKDLPAYDNSAFDGYAFCYDDLNLPLKIKGEIFAGDKNFYEIKSGECYKIMTGAIFPDGSDSVVRLEDEKFDELGRLLVNPQTRRFEARKLRGEEVNSGDKILSSGEILTPAKIMLLASQGISKVKVFCTPKICIFSSGNEINEPWEICDERSIFNANASGIEALLAKNGFESEYKGILKDDKSVIKKAIAECEKYDIIITSGGASKGEADFMKETLVNSGYSEIFSSISVRPASPTKLFKKGNRFFCVLPGNPMSAMFGCFFSALPLARKLSGFSEILPRKIHAKMIGNVKIKPSRSNVVLGNYKSGEFRVLNDNKFSPAMITPLANSNAFYVSNIGESELCDAQELNVFEI